MTGALPFDHAARRADLGPLVSLRADAGEGRSTRAAPTFEVSASLNSLIDSTRRSICCFIASTAAFDLFRHRGVLLRRLIHLTDSGIDVAHGGILLFRSGSGRRLTC